MLVKDMNKGGRACFHITLPRKCLGVSVNILPKISKSCRVLSPVWKFARPGEEVARLATRLPAVAMGSYDWLKKKGDI